MCKDNCQHMQSHSWCSVTPSRHLRGHSCITITSKYICTSNSCATITLKRTWTSNSRVAITTATPATINKTLGTKDASIIKKLQGLAIVCAGKEGEKVLRKSLSLGTILRILLPHLSGSHMYILVLEACLCTPFILASIIRGL